MSLIVVSSFDVVADPAVLRALVDERFGGGTRAFRIAMRWFGFRCVRGMAAADG